MADKKEAQERAVDTVSAGPANAREMVGAVDEHGKPRDPAKEPAPQGAALEGTADDPARTGRRTAKVDWRGGIDALDHYHGSDVSERARDLYKRALGEMYEESQGGTPASAHAHAVVDHAHDADWLNEEGDRFQLYEGAHHDATLNVRGQALPLV